MRVLLINQYYWPDVAATAQILTDLAEGLAGFGHEVTVICSRRSYTGDDNRELCKKEVRNGVSVVRVPAIGGGEGTVVGARSSVFSDLPEWKICYGTPAKPMRDRVLREREERNAKP